jgi:hypothetical protein
MIEWPEWWDWELELSQHLLKRMVDRQFNEVDLREMLEQATAHRPNHEPGRWAIETRHADEDWVVIVEPLSDEMILLVITAYPVGGLTLE